MAEKKIAVIEPEPKEKAGQYCEPECGPTTCEPTAETQEVKIVEEPRKTSSGCSPSSCS